ncbi:MAG: 5-(carboxyamino)imidazole ribonucleotide mutase [Clostridia bacterium]
MANKKVALIMGSDSDFPKLKGCLDELKNFGIEVHVEVCSAHRTPERAAEFAKTAEANGFGVIIAAAGKAAHLPGVLAAFTILPVIGIPIRSSALDGMDALLAIVQMPAGIPVATVAIDGAENAALLAVQILAVGDANLSERFHDYKKKMAEKVVAKNEELQRQLKSF